jgi:two-component system response regulator NreC
VGIDSPTQGIWTSVCERIDDRKRACQRRREAASDLKERNRLGMRIKIAIADDHAVVVNGLTSFLVEEPDIHVVGSTTRADAIVPLVEKHAPEVLVLDISGLDGFARLREVREQFPATSVVILSMHADPGHAAEALKLGATGYVTKAAPARELVHAIREVAAGRRYVPSQLAAQIEAAQRKGETLDPFDLLTERELEVLRLAAQGKRNDQIARELKIGKRTVESHRANFMRKLSIKSMTDLVRIAHARGLLD